VSGFLREDIVNENYPRNFTVLDQDDQKSIIKEAYRQYNIDVKSISMGTMLDVIADNKYSKITPEFAMNVAAGNKRKEEMAKVYAYYLQRQAEMYALDFDDLLIWTVRIFRKYDKVLEKWQYRFQYILVDEFQDIDNVQYDLIKLLAGNNNEVYSRR